MWGTEKCCGKESNKSWWEILAVQWFCLQGTKLGREWKKSQELHSDPTASDARTFHLHEDRKEDPCAFHRSETEHAEGAHGLEHPEEGVLWIGIQRGDYTTATWKGTRIRRFQWKPFFWNPIGLRSKEGLPFFLGGGGDNAINFFE